VAENSERIVLDFLSAWRRRDLDELMAFFRDDAMYHNVPVEPVRGAAAIREVFAGFLSAMPSIALDVLHSAAKGNVVFTERIDRFELAGGKRFELPVNGVFEVRGGKIASFRDYFDLASFESQSGLKL
jgi:limonene-1,2-epoxide hydrolase